MPANRKSSNTSNRCDAPCIAVLTIAALLACKTDPQTQARIKQDIDRVSQKLARLAATVPSPDDVVPQTCPDATIKANYEAKEARTYITGVEYELLDRLARRETEPFSNPWSFLTSGEISDNRSGGGFSDKSAYALRGVESRRYLAVFRARMRNEPKAEEDSFDSGNFVGALTIMDLETAQPVCKVELRAKSSEHIDYKSSGFRSKSAASALTSDFQDNVKNAATAALRSISQEIFVSIRTGTVGE